MAHEAGALVLVDGAQAVPHLPVDVAGRSAPTSTSSPATRSLAPPGSGALWARRELLESMPPFLAGGEMIREVHLRRTEFNDVPWKFEAGTPDIGAAIGLGAALTYLEGIGMDAVRAHERELVAYALDVLPREVPGIRIYGPLDPAERSGVVTFNLPGVHPHDVATLLDREAIAVRAGHHCTQPLHERLGEAATARASFNVYSGRDDIDRLAAGLAHVAAIFGRDAGAPGLVARSRKYGDTERPMDDLYRDEILEHYRRPHNFGTLPEPDAVFEGANPLCGDRITLMLGISDDGVIDEVAFTGRGCAISQASASMLTDYHQGPAAGGDRQARSPGRPRRAGHRDQPGPAQVRPALARHAAPGARRPRGLAGPDRGRRRMIAASPARAPRATCWPTPTPARAAAGVRCRPDRLAILRPPRRLRGDRPTTLP